MTPKQLNVAIAIAGMLVMGIVTGMFALMFWMANQSVPKAPTATTAAVAPRLTPGGVEFEMGYGRSVTNLASFSVLDSNGNLLWAFVCHGQDRPEVITYGELPAGAPDEYTETYPATGGKPVDIHGRQIQIQGNVRFTAPHGPGHELFEATFPIPPRPPSAP